MLRNRIQHRRTVTASLIAAGALAAAAVAATGTSGPGTPWASSAVPVTAQLASVQLAARAQSASSPAPSSSASASATASPSPTASLSPGTPRQIAQSMLATYKWPASQFTCLDPLWRHESSWQVTALNAGTGAYGIPQAMPGSKMASAGADWKTSAKTQIKWGLQYIKGTYGSPCGAWKHWQSAGWY